MLADQENTLMILIKNYKYPGFSKELIKGLGKGEKTVFKYSLQTLMVLILKGFNYNAV